MLHTLSGGPPLVKEMYVPVADIVSADRVPEIAVSASTFFRLGTVTVPRARGARTTSWLSPSKLRLTAGSFTSARARPNDRSAR